MQGCLIYHLTEEGHCCPKLFQHTIVCLLVLRWKRGRELVHCLYKKLQTCLPTSRRPAKPYFLQDNSKLIPKTIGIRKRGCAWGCAWGINTTWENLQIQKHKSVRWAERTSSWFVLFDLQIFWGGVYPPSATSRTTSFSISNSFWY